MSRCGPPLEPLGALDAVEAAGRDRSPWPQATPRTEQRLAPPPTASCVAGQVIPSRPTRPRPHRPRHERHIRASDAVPPAHGLPVEAGARGRGLARTGGGVLRTSANAVALVEPARCRELQARAIRIGQQDGRGLGTKRFNAGFQDRREARRRDPRRGDRRDRRRQVDRGSRDGPSLATGRLLHASCGSEAASYTVEIGRLCVDPTVANRYSAR